MIPLVSIYPARVPDRASVPLETEAEEVNVGIIVERPDTWPSRDLGQLECVFDEFSHSMSRAEM